MSASGRKQTVEPLHIWLIECLLWVKADIQPGTPESGLPNVRYARKSGRSAKLGLKGRL
jgi:hypothetical protein